MLDDSLSIGLMSMRQSMDILSMSLDTMTKLYDNLFISLESMRQTIGYSLHRLRVYDQAL